MRVGETSSRDYLPPFRQAFVWNEVRSWQNLTVAADALESAQGLPKEIIGDWGVAERLTECQVSAGRRRGLSCPPYPKAQRIPLNRTHGGFERTAAGPGD